MRSANMSSKIVPTALFAYRAEPARSAQEPASQAVTNAEIALVAVLALAMYTGLLLRLPYRSPVTNTLFSVLALSSFYYYLRLRLNIRMPLTMILCLTLSIVLDVIGNRYGLFSRRFGLLPYDIITHFTASGLSFIPVMWLLIALIRRFDYRLPLGFIAFFSVTTAFSLAAYYEITELMDERLLGGQRIWGVRDTVQDLAADLAGIVVAAVCYSLAVRRRSLPNHSGARSRS